MIFSLYPFQESEIIVFEGFEVSPREFPIPSGEKVDIKVVFNPTRIGQHAVKLLLACDNGSTITYTLTGNTDIVIIDVMGVNLP